MISVISNVIKALSSKVINDDKNIHDLIKAIIDGGESFKAAYYFTFDPFLPKFSCEDTFFKEGSNISDGLKNQINDFLTINSCRNLCSEVELDDGVGLFCYVAKKFLSDSNGKNTFIIKDYDNFMKYHELARFNCSIGENIIKPKSVSFFPVYINDVKPILQSMVVLYSDTINTFSENDLTTLSNLLSEILTLRINRVADRALLNFVNRLSEVNSVKNFDSELSKTLEAFRELFINQKFEKVSHSKLKYASFWTINKTDGDDIFIAKEKRKNYQTNIVRDDNFYPDILLIDRDTLSDGNHFYYSYVIELLKILDGKTDFSDFVKKCELVKLQNRFKNYYQFTQKNRLNDDDIIVIFPIISHNSGDYANGNINAMFLNLMVLVFDKTTYTYYYSSEFLEMVSHKIFENANILSRKQRRLLRQELYTDLHGLLTSPNIFFDRAAKSMTRSLNCEAVAIYILNEFNVLELKNPNKINYNLPDEIEFDSLTFDYSIFGSFFSDKIRTFFLNISDTNENVIFINNKKSFTDVLEGNEVIYSLLILPIVAIGEKVSGLIFCINNIRNVIDDENNYSSFCYQDHEIAKMGAELVLLYSKMLAHSESQSKLLKKLSHEIPGLTKLIIDNTVGIKDEVIEYRYGGKTYYRQFNKHAENMLNLISSSSHIIRIYSHYAITSGGIDKLDVQKFRVKNLLASLFHIFKSEANDLGVSFYYTMNRDDPFYSPSLNAHRFFPMVLINVIRNAIHYAHFGSKVHLFIKETKGSYTFIVRNIGIPIFDEDKDRIFKKEYRTKEAQAKYFKGTGYGLSFVNEIIKACNGVIEIENENDFHSRNIYGISSLIYLFNTEPTLKENIYNLFVPASREKIRFWDNYLTLSDKENAYLRISKNTLTNDRVSVLLENHFDSFKKYRDLQLSSKVLEGDDESERKLVAKKFIEEKLKGGEDMDNIYKKYLDVSLNLTTFIIKI